MFGKCIIFLAVVVSVNSNECVINTFEDDVFDTLFDNTFNPCNPAAMQLWQRVRYSDSIVESPNERSEWFITTSASITMNCINSYIFFMTPGGLLEINAYLILTTASDFFAVIVNTVDANGNPTTVSPASITITLNMDYEGPGWHTIRLNLQGEAGVPFRGYVSFMAIELDAATTIIVDSFRYIPPDKNEDYDCLLYPEDETTPAPTSTTTDTTTTETTTTPTTTTDTTTTETTTIPTTTTDTTTTETTTIPTTTTDTTTTETTTTPTTTTDTTTTETTTNPTTTTDTTTTESTTTPTTTTDTTTTETTTIPTTTADTTTETTTTPTTTTDTTTTETTITPTTSTDTTTTDTTISPSTTTDTTTTDTTTTETTTTPTTITETTTTDATLTPTTTTDTTTTDTTTTDASTTDTMTLPTTTTDTTSTETTTTLTTTIDTTTTADDIDTTILTTLTPYTTMPTYPTDESDMTSDDDMQSTTEPTIILPPETTGFWTWLTITMVVLLCLLFITIISCIAYFIGRYRANKEDVDEFQFSKAPQILPRVRSVYPDINTNPYLKND